MSAKMAVISSTTWLTGWMRPRSMPLVRTESVTSAVSALSFSATVAPSSPALRAAIAALTRSRRPLMRGP